MSLVDLQMKSEDLLQKEQLDVGGFGMVSLCYHKNHGLVVLKTVYTGPKRTDCNTSLLEEGKIMQRLNHDRVVKLLGVILEDGNYSLVMEYIRKGNLMSVLKATAIPLSVKGRFILEIIEGMLYLTEQGLVHKDLKPENILVDEDFHIKIADLGVACFKNWSKLTKEETIRQRKIKYSSQSNAGTLFYMAPEHLRDINTTPVEKSDVYSFSIVLWSIFANKEPYENAVNDLQVYFCIMNGDRPQKEDIEENCPAEIITLMEQAWKQEPKQRPTFAEISLTYKPFYQENLEKYVEEDVRKIKEVYPDPPELVKRMESLQVDAVAEPPSTPRTDLPSSLHSSQDAGTVDERFFEACPENEPVESCENNVDPPPSVERKLQDELNYHMYGSWMDRAESHRVAYSAAAHESERRRKVSYDPFAKLPAMPHAQGLDVRPKNSGSVVYPGSANANAAPYSYSWKPTPATPETAHVSLDPTGLYGAGPANLRTPSPEDLYGLHPASKLPVPESGGEHHPESTNPYFNPYLKSQSAGAGVAESTPFTKTNFAHSPSYGHSTGEPALTIINSSGIQIGSYNCLKITDHTVQANTATAKSHNNSAEYQKLFDSTAVVSEMHLNVARDNLGKHWKHFARKLGFQDPELDEIDHDYERTAITSAKVEVNGVHLHYQQTGEGSHAILLLPGMLGSGQTDFGPQLKSLNKQLFTLVAWDPRGYGKSIPPARDFPLDFFERDAKDAVDLMQALRFKKFSLLGWSDGGITALIAAAKYPDLIHKMVVWGANAHVTEEDAKLYNGIRDIAKWSERTRKPMEAMYGHEYLSKTCSAWVDGISQFIHRPDGNICQSLLPHITCPTLIIHGEKDPLVPRFHPEYIHKHIAHSRLHFFPEGKHNLHLRFAEEFNELVEKFLL